jgi:hypothetical protein
MGLLSGLGRYEMVGGKHDKYWHIIFDKTKRQYTAQWGSRKATKPMGTKIYSEKEARKKIEEKMDKGYHKVKGYQETVGANAAHFIMSDEAA